MRTTTIGLVVLALTASACGSSSTRSTSQPPAASTPAAASGAAAAAGTYTRQLTASDIARTDGFRVEGTNQSAPPPGALTLTLDEGKIVVTDEAGFAIAETSALGDDSTLEIQSYVDPSKASFCGPDAPQNASYTWKLDGNGLTLAPVEDRCADRNAMLTGSWTRSG